MLNLPNPNEYKRVMVLPVGAGGCRLIITEYFVWKGGERVQTKLTLKTTPAFGRPS